MSEQKPPKVKKISAKTIGWAESLIKAPRRIYYKRHGNKATCICGKCGGEYTGRINPPEKFEDQFEKYIDKPEHGEPGKCPLCGTEGVYKAEGLAKRQFKPYANYIVGQNLGEDFVFRAFYVVRTCTVNQQDQTEHYEYARVYLRKGKKEDKWWYVCRWGEYQWVNYYPGVFGQYHIYTDHYSPDTYTEIQKTPMLKYGDPGRRDLIYYYAAFARYPDMELVQKAGMTDLLSSLLAQRGSNINPRGRTIHDRLRIYKHRVADLKAHDGDMKYLKIYQEERKNKTHYENKDIDARIWILKNFWSTADRKTLEDLLKYASIERIIKYMDSPECISKWVYFDYIRMRQKEGYEISGVHLFPKDLQRKHNALVRMIEKKKNDQYKAECLAKYPKIADKYEKLKKMFEYTNGAYMIRPAADAAEIVEEGRCLHHCVGSSSTYFTKHSKGESFILFLRKVQKPDEPYATVEISGSRILQWYEANDKKPHEKDLQPWLDAYTEYLKSKKSKKVKKTA